MTEFTQLEVAFEECDFLKERFVDTLHYATTELTLDSQVEFLHTLYALIEKEQSIALRLSFMEKPIANLMLERLAASSLYQDIDLKNVNEFYRNLKNQVRLNIIEITGEDLDEPVDM